jgi:hypothetical protein
MSVRQQKRGAVQFEQVFTSAIEAGTAVAGFSGIVAVLGRRAEGQWSPSDRVRVTLLLQTSFAAIGLSFLALVLDGAGVADPTTWKVGSACYALYAVLAVVPRVRLFRTMTETDPSFAPTLAKGMVVVVFFVAALQIYNAALLGMGWPFALAVIFELVVALAVFVRLLQDAWSEPAA